MWFRVLANNFFNLLFGFARFNLNGLFLFLVLFFCTSGFTVFAQNNILNQKISLNVHNEPLWKVLTIISGQSGALFSYSVSNLENNTTITLIADRKTVGQILTELSHTAGFTFYCVEKQIIIKSIPEDFKDSIPSKKRIIISGFVRDSESGEPLLGASVFSKFTATGTITNGYGFFSLQVPEGNNQLQISYIGYSDTLISVRSHKNLTFSVNLVNSVYYHDIIAVNESLTEKNLKVLVSETEKFTNTNMRKIPGFGTSFDFTAALSSVAGISRVTDGSAFFYVRGGEKDQNLILVDEAPVFHPSHLFGIFSAIVPSAINTLTTYKSGIPIKYGGRVSSLIDIRIRDGDMQKYEMSGELSPFALSVHANYPFLKNKLTVAVFYRHSVLKPWLRLIGNTDPNKFSDIHFKTTYRINERSKLSVSAYYGADFYSGTQINNYHATQWHNLAVSARYTTIYNPKLFTVLAAYLGNYNYKLYSNSLRSDFWNSGISNYGLRYDITAYKSNAVTLQFGSEINYHQFNPAQLYLNNRLNDTRINPGNVVHAVVYAGINRQLGSRLAFLAGFRLHNWNNTGFARQFLFNNQTLKWDTLTQIDKIYNSYLLPEIRSSVILKINPVWYAKASVAQNIQFLHLINNSYSQFTSFDLWLPSGFYHKPMRTMEYNFDLVMEEILYHIKLSTFYKKTYNQPDYVDHANMILNALIQTQFATGTQTALGAEFTLEKKRGLLTYSLTYTYINSYRQINGINNDKPYPANYHKPNAVNLWLSYVLNKSITLQAVWNFSTGNPYTAPSGFYTYSGYKIPYYTQRNNIRMPNYHRLDISAVYQIKMRINSPFIHELAVSVYNVYNHKNFMSVFYNKISAGNNNYYVPGNYLTENELLYTGLTMPGIVPFFSYRITLNDKKNEIVP